MRLLSVLLLCAVATGCGYGSKTTTPPKPGTMPTISQLTPPNIANNSGPFTLEVDGASFAANAVINFNGVKQTTTYVSTSKLTATIPNSAITTVGQVPVTVTNPAIP